MAPGTIALDALGAGAVLAMIAIVLFGVLGAVIAVRTLVAARRRAATPHPGWLADLARGCAVSELADLNEELRRIAESEYAASVKPR